MNDEFWTLLVSQAFQLTLVSLSVWVVTRALTRNRPHLSHALWGLVLLKCLMPPVWSSPTGVFSRMELPNWSSNERRPTPTSLSIAKQDAVTTESELPGSTRLSASIYVEPLANATDLGHEVKGLVVSQQAISDWRRWIIPIWLAGAAVWLLVFLSRLGSFCFRLWRMPQIDVPEVHQLTKETARQLGLRRSVSVRVIDGDIGPAVVGFLRPVILLPACIATKVDTEQLRPLIAHELVHVRRGDLLWALIQTLSNCLWWFHPLIWTATRHVSREAEKSCDQETILGLGCSPATYARGLLNVLERKNELKVAPALPGVRPIEVTKSRMERIMTIRQGHDRRTPRWIWVAMLCAAAAILPGSNWVTAQDQPSAASNDTAANTTKDDQSAEDEGNTHVEAEAAGDASVEKPAERLPILPSPPRGEREIPADVWTIRTYKVDSILKRLTDSGLKREAAEERLLQMLPASTEDKLRRDASILDGNGKPVELGNENPRRLIQDEQLIVFDGKVVHEEIAKLLRQYDRFGFDVVHIESTIALVPTDRWDEIDIEWPDLSAASNPIGQANQDFGNSADRADIIPQPRPAPAIPPAVWPNPRPAQAIPRATPAASNASANEKSSPARPDLLPRLNLPRAVPVVQASARTVTRETPQLSIAVLENSDLADTLRDQPGIGIISRPQVLTLNGQTASVEVGRRIPIVTGYRTSENQNGKSKLEPLVEEVQEGTTMRLTPELRDDRFVQLELHIEVQSVKKDALEAEEKQGRRVKIPVISSSYIESAVNVPLGSTLAIGGLVVEQNGMKNRLLCLIRCRKVESEEMGSKSPAKPQTPDIDSQKNPPKPRPSTQGNVQPGPGNLEHGSARYRKAFSVRLPSIATPMPVATAGSPSAADRLQRADDQTLQEITDLIRAGDFETADTRLAKHREQFPESKNRVLAYRLSLLCKLKLCETDSSQSMAAEAVALLKEARQTYPDQTADSGWQSIARKVNELAANVKSPDRDTNTRLESNGATKVGTDDDANTESPVLTGFPAHLGPSLLGWRNLNLQARSVETSSTPEPTVRAEEVVLRGGDGTRVTADHMELQLSDENAEARLRGRVKLDLDSMQLRANQGRIRSDRVELSGAVSFIAEGMQGTCTGLTLTEGGILSLVGDVRLQKGGDDKSTKDRRPQVELQAESIRLRIDEGPIVVDSVNLKRLDLRAVRADRDE